MIPSEEGEDIEYTKAHLEAYVPSMNLVRIEGADKDAYPIEHLTFLGTEKDTGNPVLTDNRGNGYIIELTDLIANYEQEVPEGITEQEVREILGRDNVLGQEEVKQVFEVNVPVSELPTIPYTPEQLESAKAAGMMLVLRIDKDKEGNPLTGKRIQEMFEANMVAQDKGKLLYDTDWYKDEPFFKTETPTMEWKLVTKDLIPDSKNKDYTDGTRLLRDTLKAAGNLTKEEQEAIDECTDQKLTELKTLQGTDWTEAAKQLSELKINKNHRRTFSEGLYDFILRFHAKDNRLLESTYDWTQSLSSVGSLVDFGYFDADGSYVDGWRPGSRYGDLGVSFSR